MNGDGYSTRLAHVLREAELVAPGGARGRAIGAAGDQAEGRAAGSRGARRRPSMRVLGAAAIVVLIAFVSLTPPGRAIARDVGVLVGLVDRPPEPQAAISACPDDIKIADRAGCKLIAKRTHLSPCPNPRSGGDVRVAGVRCKDAYELIGPLGGTGVAGLANYKRTRQTLYRPAVATYHRPFEIRDTGWTCWNSFEKGSPYGTQFVCWRGASVLTFKFF